MTQHLFNGEATSDKAQLDANFADLYGKTRNLAVPSPAQTIFAGVLMCDADKTSAA